MNVNHYYNPISSFKTSFLNSSYTFNGRTFRQVFDDVWRHSEARVNSVHKEINDLPLSLVDKNGKAVILKEDIENDIRFGSPQDQISQAIEMWNFRLAYYHHLRLKNQKTDLPIAEYNLSAHSRRLAFDNPQYFNTLGLIAINGYALYSAENTAFPITEFVNQLEKKNFVFDDLIKAQLPPNPLTNNLIGITRGNTYINANPLYNPISVVDVSAISAYLESRHVIGSAFGTACHELAHGWCYLALEDGLENERANHASHITGLGSNYCLFRTVPKGKEYDNAITNEQISQFLIQKTVSMKFSKGIQQRLANRFSVSKK